VVNDFLKESIRVKAREMVNDKFLDGVMDGIVVDTRMKMGEFNSFMHISIMCSLVFVTACNWSLGIFNALTEWTFEKV